MAFNTWLYKGRQGGLKTRIQQYPDGEIAILQQKDGGDPFTLAHRLDYDLVVFKEAELRKLLKKLKKVRKCAGN